MQRFSFICIYFFICIGTLSAQVPEKSFRNNDFSAFKETSREYSIIVYEKASDSPLSLDREISKGRSGGFFSGIYDVYRDKFANKVTNLSSSILGTGIELIVNAFEQKRENHNKWLSTMEKELTYTKKLPMQTEIADFYRNPSSVGAMDPNGMMFDGIGCRQYLTYRENDGSTKKILVFEIACSLNDSERGKQRILNHGKFEIKVDSIYFNPYLCDLPNDGLTISQVKEALRIPFDFNKRRNLHVKLNATISSSWMNEAIEIFKDQVLGNFQIEFTIPDSTVLDRDGEWKGYYTYKAQKDYLNKQKNVRVSGDCFIVPRSFIGNYQEDSSSALEGTTLWGTGQYRVDMEITESCQMNETYYSDENKWKEEWKKIKKRKESQHLFGTIVDMAKTEFDLKNHKWIHTILDPIHNAMIVDEKKWINQIVVGENQK